jgi:hypothetical protein
VLDAFAANSGVGLDWSRVKGATGYRVFFANTPGVTPTTGSVIDVPDPAYVHRSWIDEVFRMEPYARMRDAFVVWFLPRPSAAHTGAGDTAFHVTVTCWPDSGA